MTAKQSSTSCNTACHTISNAMSYHEHINFIWDEQAKQSFAIQKDKHIVNTTSMMRLVSNIFLYTSLTFVSLELLRVKLLSRKLSRQKQQ
jgi:hypothetical protein